MPVPGVRRGKNLGSFGFIEQIANHKQKNHTTHHHTGPSGLGACRLLVACFSLFTAWLHAQNQIKVKKEKKSEGRHLFQA
jgi:hypothetical protein